MHLLPPVAAVVHAGLGHPGHVGVVQEVEIALLLARRGLDPRRTGAVVVPGVDHGRDEIGVEQQQTAGAGERRALRREVAAGDRLDVAGVERPAVLLDVGARGLRHPGRGEAPGQVLDERRLAGRLGTGRDHAQRRSHEVTGWADGRAPCAGARRHSIQPATASARNPA